MTDEDIKLFDKDGAGYEMMALSLSLQNYNSSVWDYFSPDSCLRPFFL